MMLKSFIGKSTPLTIGMNYLGGNIAYLDNSGIHGFVCTLTDVSNGVKWWSSGFPVIGAFNNTLQPDGVYGITKSGGRLNTDLIVSANDSGNNAAKLCAALTIGGATPGEWYLPSLPELHIMAINLQLSLSYYWSSTEVSYESSQAWSEVVQSHISTVRNKGQLDWVRAIRAF